MATYRGDDARRDGDEDYIELSERFEKSAEVVNFAPSDEYERPPTMSMRPTDGDKTPAADE
jgi:hypothetical protein